MSNISCFCSEENTSKTSTEVVQTMSSRTVVTRTVVSETLEDGRVVSSETTTTTVTGGDASGAAEPTSPTSTGNLSLKTQYSAHFRHVAKFAMVSMNYVVTFV